MQSLDRYEIENILKPHLNRKEAVCFPASDCQIGENVCLSENLSLNGTWEMIEQSGDNDFSAATEITVPCGIHCELLRQGMIKDQAGEVITDPYFAKNDEILREISKKSFRLRKLFTLTEAQVKKRWQLVFEGVCDTCEVWLNGKALGKHVGMFGGPDYEVTSLLQPGENELMVLLYAAPFRPRKPYEFPTFFGGGNPWLNLGWLDTVTFNCVYGWHYADIPPIGIWRSVLLREIPSVSIESPFVQTVDTNGNMRLELKLRSTTEQSVHFFAMLEPFNFVGERQTFAMNIKLDTQEKSLALSFVIKNPQLWWPNGLGKQNLYTIKLAVSADNVICDEISFRFGIRTVEMIANTNENGERIEEPGRYNWTFAVNGKPFFIKGTGWCTTDALMRFDRSRYDRFLSLAKQQNVNMVRAWGGGLVETDDFYDICDEYGITVFQEWPTAWDSYMIQPRKALLETVKRNIIRLRNRASLFLWCGGNEGCAPLEKTDLFDPTVLNEIGKLTIEMDPTRPWHRQEPCGGSMHDYRASWEWKNPETTMTMEAPFFGEFGVDCWPNIESVRRYTPEKELSELEQPGNEFVIPGDGIIAHHTPMFNKSNDVGRLQQNVDLFIKPDTMSASVLGSQLKQVIGVRHTLERARTRFGACGGAIMYKLNDPYPTASWSTVDWYGTPKAGHYFVADAFAPVAAIARFDHALLIEETVVPIYVCNDNGTAVDAVTVRIYGGNLQTLESVTFIPKTTSPVELLGSVVLTDDIVQNAPIFVVTEVLSAGKQIARNWYFLNYEKEQGCLFRLPHTELSVKTNGTTAVICNTGDVPAVAVQFDCQTVSDTFFPSDNWFWLDAGEEITVSAPDFSGVNGVFGWNA